MFDCRCGISPEALIAMKNSTVLGLAKYMEADMSEMEMQVCTWYLTEDQK